MNNIKYEYKLSDAINLFVQQTSIKNNLWSIFVAATFAAGGFSISSTLNYQTGSLVIIAYWTFSMGHLYLLNKCVVIMKKLEQEIIFFINLSLSSADEPFQSSLRTLAKSASKQSIVICLHLTIDICVTGVLLERIQWYEHSNFHHEYFIDFIYASN